MSFNQMALLHTPDAPVKPGNIHLKIRLNGGARRQCKKIVDFGDKNGQNRHQHLIIVINTFCLQHRHQHRFSLMSLT